MRMKTLLLQEFHSEFRFLVLSLNPLVALISSLLTFPLFSSSSLLPSPLFSCPGGISTCLYPSRTFPGLYPAAGLYWAFKLNSPILPRPPYLCSASRLSFPHRFPSLSETTNKELFFYWTFWFVRKPLSCALQSLHPTQWPLEPWRWACEHLYGAALSFHI